MVSSILFPGHHEVERPVADFGQEVGEHRAQLRAAGASVAAPMRARRCRFKESHPVLAAGFVVINHYGRSAPVPSRPVCTRGTTQIAVIHLFG